MVAISSCLLSTAVCHGHWKNQIMPSLSTLFLFFAVSLIVSLNYWSVCCDNKCNHNLYWYCYLQLVGSINEKMKSQLSDRVIVELAVAYIKFQLLWAKQGWESFALILNSCMAWRDRSYGLQDGRCQYSHLNSLKSADTKETQELQVRWEERKSTPNIMTKITENTWSTWA